MAEDLTSQGWYAPVHSGNGPYGTMEGQLGGGGFINETLGNSSHDGMGLWRPAIGEDPESLVGPIGAEGTKSGDYFMDLTEQWDDSYMDSRRPDWRY